MSTESYQNQNESPSSEGAAPTAPALSGDIRESAVNVLTLSQRSDTSLQHLLRHELEREDLPDTEKRYLFETCNGVMRWLGKLDWILNGFYHGEYIKCIPQMKNALRIGVYELLYLEGMPIMDAIGFAADAVGRLKGEHEAAMAETVLSSIYRNAESIRYPDPREDAVRYMSVVASHPWWLTKRWIEQFGEHGAMDLMLANNEPPMAALRINKLRIERKNFLEQLQEKNITHVQSPVSDMCIAVDILPPFEQYDMYRNGWVSVYDESSALAVMLLNAQYDESIISLCAGTTGKTLHVAETTNNLSRIAAVDLFDVKSKELSREATRLGIISLNAVTADPAGFSAPIADRVLVDAPNSNTGMFTSIPDQKWKCSPELVEEYGNYQLRLLRRAAQLVKPGGVIVYATHSLMQEENRDVVNAFLTADSRFTVDRANRYVKQEYTSADGFVETFPHIHNIEGLFAARLVRK
ncbi:MAG TPA: transcription antitermination factor NusB [Candidatus Kapabacteria bacterium]|nr:transcription antitermination factor NusB [Candidatus Kapabacteria bacterium]